MSWQLSSTSVVRREGHERKGAIRLIYVVFDSAVIIKDYRFRSLPLKVLLEESRKGAISIAVPKVVFEEVTNKWREEAAGVLADIQNRAKRLGIEPSIMAMPDLTQLADRYASWLQLHLNEHKVRWLDIPDVSHEILVRNAIQKRKPFKENGAGYRDALIWESVKHLAKESSGEVLFLSYDKIDFGSKSGALHADLLRDLQEAQLRPDRVSLMTEPAAVVARFVTPAVTALKWFADKIRDDESYKQRVVEALRDKLDRSMRILDQSLRPGEFIWQIRDIRPIPDSGRVLNAWVIGKSRIGVELEIDAAIDVLLDVHNERSRVAPVTAELDLIAPDESSQSQTVHGIIIGQLELPEESGDEIYDAYAYIASVSDSELP